MADEPVIVFSREELERYSRQILLFGRAGQNRLKQARVGVIGAGGLGNPAMAYLAASGIGYLRIADFDQVERHNLSRQFLFSEADCGRNKTSVLREQLTRINPHTQVDSFQKITDENISQFSDSLDLILEGSDDLSLKFKINDFAQDKKIPLVIGAMGPTQGHIFPVFPLPNLPCYRCLFYDEPQTPPPTCASAGVISPLAGVLGSMMASLAVQFLAQGLIPNRMLLLEQTNWRNIKISKNPDCPLCGDKPNLPTSRITIRPQPLY